MRIQSRIIFHMDPPEAEQLLSKFNLSAKKNQRMQVVKLFVDSDYYLQLTQELVRRGVEFSEYKTEVYSKKEIETSELLRIIPNTYCGYPQPEMDDSYFEVSYDPNSVCPKCLQGGVQKNPFQMFKPKIGKSDIAGIHWVLELIITQRLKEIIEAEGLTGVEFWPVVNYRKKTEYEGLYQLFITNEMPPMSPEAEIVRAPDVRECECGKKGYVRKGVPVYSRESLVNIKDFNKTHEWLGGGETTWQSKIVTKKVYDLFQQHKVRGVRFEPVKII